MTVSEKIEEVDTKLKLSPILKVDDFHVTYLTESVKHVTLDGLWIEFGVYRGRALAIICTLTENIVYGFDSFEGLPDYWNDENPKGVYSLAGTVPPGYIIGDVNQSMYSDEPTENWAPWPKNCRLVKGWFENTLKPFCDHHKEKAAYIHIDSDIYSAAKTIFTEMKDRIVPGTVLVFDEIENYPEYKDHEIKAFSEFLLDNPELDYEVINHSNFNYGQATILIK